MKNKKINLVGSPLNFSESPVKYKKTPPTLGEDTDKILKEFLKLNSSDLKRLKEKKIIWKNIIAEKLKEYSIHIDERGKRYW